MALSWQIYLCIYSFLQSAKLWASLNYTSLTTVFFHHSIRVKLNKQSDAVDKRNTWQHRLLMQNTYVEIKDKSRLSKSLKISLYRLVSDLWCTFFTSEMRNGNAKIYEIRWSLSVILWHHCRFEILRCDPHHQSQTTQTCWRSQPNTNILFL